MTPGSVTECWWRTDTLTSQMFLFTRLCLVRTRLLSASFPLHTGPDTLTFSPAHPPQQLHPDGRPDRRHQSTSEQTPRELNRNSPFSFSYLILFVSVLQWGWCVCVSCSCGGCSERFLVHSEQLPGRCNQLLQQSVSWDQRRLSVDGSRLVPGLVSATGRELLTGGDLSGCDAVLVKVLTHTIIEHIFI